MFHILLLNIGGVFFYMSRGQITKEQMKNLILKQKHKLFQESNLSLDSIELANRQLDELLYKLEEFRY